MAFAQRWSAALSLYYSAWNYGATDHKYRTFIFRPEARYWVRRRLDGLYLQAHAQMAAYNFALPHWVYRIQDTGGKHPALGGGVGVGYRFHPCCPCWGFEAAVGFGVYHLRYDRFENRAGGPRVDTRSRTWCGIDNLSLGVVYTFNASSR